MKKVKDITHTDVAYLNSYKDNYKNSTTLQNIVNITQKSDLLKHDTLKARKSLDFDFIINEFNKTQNIEYVVLQFTTIDNIVNTHTLYNKDKDAYENAKKIKKEEIKHLIDTINKETEENKRTEHIHKLFCDYVYKTLKSSLKCFVVGATFKDKKNDIKKYNNLILVDVDFEKNPSKRTNDDFNTIEKVQKAYTELKKDPYVVMLSKSISGDGYHIVFALEDYDDNNEISEKKIKENHYKFYYAVEKYFLDKYKIQVDISCKNYNRLSFISYDEDIYTNFDNYKYFDDYYEKEDVVIYVEEKCGNLKNKKNIKKENDKTANSNNVDFIEYYSNTDDATLFNAFENTEPGKYTLSYNQWLSFGYMLLNTYENFEEAASRFVTISKKCKKFTNEQDCISKLKSLSNNLDTSRSLTIKALFEFAAKTKVLSQDEIKKLKLSDYKYTAVDAIEIIENKLNKKLYFDERTEIYYISDYDYYLKNKDNIDIYKLKKLTDYDVIDILNSIRKIINTEKFSKNTLYEYMFTAAKNTRIDILRMYCDSLRTSDSTHFDNFMKSFKCSNISFETQYKYLTNFMLKSIRKVYSPTEYNDSFIFFKGAQEIGKTYILRDRFLKDVFNFGDNNFVVGNYDINSQNSHEDLKLYKYLFHASDEASARTVKDNSRLKQFTSENTVDIRKMYSQINIQKPILMNVVNYTNEDKIINDPTGTRRFYILEISHFNYRAFNNNPKYQLTKTQLEANIDEEVPLVDFKKVWGYIIDSYLTERLIPNTNELYITYDEHITVNDEYTTVNDTEMLVDEIFTISDKYDILYKDIVNILHNEAVNRKLKYFNKNDVSVILKKLGITKQLRKIKGKQYYFYNCRLKNANDILNNVIDTKVPESLQHFN